MDQRHGNHGQDGGKSARQRDAEQLDPQIREQAEAIQRGSAPQRAGVDQANGHMRDVVQFIDGIYESGDDLMTIDSSDELMKMFEGAACVLDRILAMEGNHTSVKHWSRMKALLASLDERVAHAEVDRRESGADED